jgi:hypothetical protein
MRLVSKAEREELSKVIRLRAKVAKNAIHQRQAELLADAEEKLSAKYKMNDPAWAEITRAAELAVAQADEQVAQICRERGIPEDFRPQLGILWYGRGENAYKERRDELRRLARAQVERLGVTCKAAIEAKEAELLTAVIAGGLESDEARAFLGSIPSPDHLMPPVIIEELEVGKMLSAPKS